MAEANQRIKRRFTTAGIFFGYKRGVSMGNLVHDRTEILILGLWIARKSRQIPDNTEDEKVSSESANMNLFCNVFLLLLDIHSPFRPRVKTTDWGIHLHLVAAAYTKSTSSLQFLSTKASLWCMFVIDSLFFGESLEKLWKNHKNIDIFNPIIG